MPTHAGPNTKGQENLVFGYDLGDTKNSFRGAPTINYASGYNAVKQSSYSSYSATADGTWNAKHPNAIYAYNADGTNITGFVNTGVTDWTNTYHAVWEYDVELDKPVVVMDCTDSNWKAKSFAPMVSGTWASNGWGVGTKYVISWLQWTTHLDKSLHVGLYTRNSSNSQNFWDGLSNNSTTSRNTKIRTWQRVYHVFTVTSNWDQTIDYVRMYMYGHHFRNGAGVKIKVANVQLEIDQDYPSPFTGNQAGVSGRSVRSATQGLLDLTGNSTIDLSNVSFDSNAQMTFDGTSDKLAFPSGLDIPSSGGSIEMVVKRNGTSTNRFLFSKVESGTNRYYMRQPTETTYDAVRGNPLSSTSFGTINTGVYYHLVMVWQNTNLYAYKNGVLESSTTFTNPGSNLNSSGAYIGAFDGGSSGNIAADIALTKFYNRALTASEIKANYNAIKGRFNI